MDKPKLCLYCSDPMEGRLDKMFCNPNCKSAHHYKRSHEKEAGSVALILFKVKILIFAITILKICSNITVFQNRSFYKPFISN